MKWLLSLCVPDGEDALYITVLGNVYKLTITIHRTPNQGTLSNKE